MAIYLYGEDFADRFNSTQGLDDDTLVELNDTTTWMAEFIALFVGEPQEEHNYNESDFYSNGLGILRDAITAKAREELNGMFEFEMEYPSDGFLVDELKEERIIKAKAQDKLGYQLFRIYSINKNHDNDTLTVNAQHITYDLADNFIESLNASDLTKKQVMELIGTRTVRPHPFNITSTNNSTRSSTKLYRTNPLQMVAGMEGSVLQIWGGQIERDNFDLIMHDRRGHDDGVTITYEKNITGLDATFDISGLVTRIYPFVYIDATDDSPERLITVNGKYIDSPLINHYTKVYIEPVDYSHDDRIDLQDKTDEEIRTQLTNLANNYFEETGNDNPKATVEVNFAHLWDTEEYKDVAPLELVGMGDTVKVNHSRLKVDATAIVNRIVYDCIAEVNEEVGIGNIKARFSDTVNKISRIEKKANEAQSSANKAIISANGKNTIFYGPDAPTSGMILNDTWFEQVDSQFVRTWRFDGIQWQVMIDMDSYEAKQNALLATQNAQDALDQAQGAFNKALENATEIDDLALSIGDVAEGTTIVGTIQGLQTTVTNLENDVTSQITQLTNAINLRVEKDDIINQINISTESILISGKKLILDGDTTVNGDFKLDGSAHILDASIGTAQIAELDAGKIVSGTLDTNLLTVRGGSATDYTLIDGSFFESRGSFTRTWQSVTETHDIKIRLQNGYFRLRNDNKNRSLYISDFGVSTFAEGTGDGSGNRSSGTIEFFSRRFNSSLNGLTLYSSGVIGADANVITLLSEYGTSLESTDGLINIRPTTAKRSYDQTFRFSTSNSNGDGYLSYGNADMDRFSSSFRFSHSSSPHIEVVDENYETGGETGIIAGYGYFNTVRRRGGNLYVNLQHANIMRVGADSSNRDRIEMMAAYNWTATQSANMHITSSGTVARSTSARKYKTDIEPITAEYAYNFYKNVHPVYYKPKNTHDENMEYSHYGYIADDVALIEPRLVQFGENGEPESFNYDRVPTLLHVVMKEEVKRIDKLESIVKIQQQTIESLQYKIAKMESAA